MSTLLAVAVTALALGLPLGFTALRLVQDVTQQELDDSAQRIAAAVDDQLSASKSVDIRSIQQLAVPHDGRITVTYPGTGELTYGDDPGPSGLRSTVPIVRNGHVTLAVPADPLRAKQFQVALLVVLLAVASVGIGTVVATVTARRLAKPLRYVADRAARLGAGDFRIDPRRHGIPELDRVSHTLDASTMAVAELLQRERDLVGDVSHQLRSRLTALQLRLEPLAEHEDPPTAKEAQAAFEQAERLAEVLDELLAAARAAREVDAEPVDLSEELPAIAAEWREPLKADGRLLKLQVPDGLLARATRTRLREAIGVLLDNALRHGEGVVTLSAHVGDRMAIVEVNDDGPGVPQELVGHVFERGVSGVGSTGLGLALAMALVEADGGRLKLASTKPATFSIFLRRPREGDLPATLWRAEPWQPR